MKRTIFLVSVLCSLIFASKGEAQMGSRLLLFNTVMDLLKGDIWESVTQEGVSRYLYVYPENFQVLGIGTTTRPHRMGEMMVWGPVGSTTYWWANPEYPYQISKVQDERFPWLQVALFDPQKALNWDLGPTKDLHRSLIERMHREGVHLCALYLEAITLRVEYNLTNWIPKSGVDMRGFDRGNPFFQAFQDETSARWVFFGIYADEEVGKSCGMLPGQPLLMMGYNRDTLNGGLVKFAEIQSARVQYCPIETCQILQSDLTVTDARVHENRVSIDVQNVGELSAEHVRVRLSLPDSEREMDAILPSLEPMEEKTVRFRLKKSPSDKNAIVAVDPENEILEADETNNRFEKVRPFWGW